ncbi:MAG: hypothetical protein DCF12_10485, partial [Snowella sp.]
MKKSEIKLLIIFSLTTILVYSSQVFAQTPSTTPSPEANSFFNTALWQSIVVAVLSAVLAFITGYALAGISKKQGSGKKLSYSLLIENGLVKIEKNIREKVKVLYNSEEIENLYNISFNLENTGTTVIKAQEIRFEFPQEARILDFSFEPEPEQEMKAEKIESGLRSFEKKCKIGQIERGQSLGIRFTATSKSEIQEVKLHPYNESGDIEFTSRLVTKALSNRDQIARFLSLYIFYLVVPPIFYLLPFGLGEMMAGFTRFILLLSLFRLIVPFSEILADIVFRHWFSLIIRMKSLQDKDLT